MGKQAQAKSLALANALKKEGDPVKTVPVKEEPVKEAPKPRPKPKPKEEPQQKTKKEIEKEQQQLVEDNARKKAEFYEVEAARKLQECKGIEDSVTYVEDKSTRKPVAHQDLSDYWKVDLGIMPFMPSDNVGMAEELPPDVDPADRIAFLELFREQLQQLLKMKFHIFWSQVVFDEQVRKALDSYLRFCLRSHDVARCSGADTGESTLVVEEGSLATEISRSVLAIYFRLSRPQESSHEFLSEKKFGELVFEKHIFDIPKLIDICTIYGDSNRSTVTRIVHSVFAHQPVFIREFEKSVVPHMLSSLNQCCAPLQQAGSKAKPHSVELGIDDCLSFLPDLLSCFNAVFCFFPEECIEALVGGSVARRDGSARMPLDELMVNLHEAVLALEKRGGKTGLKDIKSLFQTIRMLLCRLLSGVLGFQMAPRRGAAAFDELLEWCKARADNHSDLLHDLSRYGLENLAIEWHASGLVDDALMDFLEQICGSMLPPEARTAKQRHARAKAAASSAASSSTQPAASSSQSTSGSASDAAKIREVRGIVGDEFGEGFILQCLLHYGFSVNAVVNAILDGSLPPQLETMKKGLKMGEDPGGGMDARENTKMSADDKRRIVDQTSRMAKEEVEARTKMAEMKKATAAYDEYDDDHMEGDDEGFVKVTAGKLSESEEEQMSGESSGEDGDRQWGPDRGKGGKIKGGGKSRGKGGPVQGQTYDARRKQENKAKYGNHNRANLAMKKQGKGMM